MQTYEEGVVVVWEKAPSTNSIRTGGKGDSEWTNEAMRTRLSNLRETTRVDGEATNGPSEALLLIL